jgi:hypothetical protein
MSDGPCFKRRGMVFTPSDLYGPAWVPLMARAGLNLVALHGSVEEVLEFTQTKVGRRFLAEAEAAGLEHEYELHAMSWLLPREQFSAHPDWFRMDQQGQRRPDANLCASNPEGLSMAAARAVELAERLPPSTERYYFWPDDNGAWCHCDACRGFAPSDQLVLVMNALMTALRAIRPEAQLSCLAYLDCLTPPTTIAPAPGLFLEYAPIRRCYRHALSDPDCALNREHAAGLPALLAAFGSEGAQALEYWLDASMFSAWRRPARHLPFQPALLAADLVFYAGLGFHSATTFGVFLDAYYFATHGTPPVAEYGHALMGATGDGQHTAAPEAAAEREPQTGGTCLTLGD